jgi:hypothetical protein
MAKGQAQAAPTNYREAVRIHPGSARAAGLGSAPASPGDVAGAVPHLQKAAAGADSAARKGAAQIWRQLEKSLDVGRCRGHALRLRRDGRAARAGAEDFGLPAATVFALIRRNASRIKAPNCSSSTRASSTPTHPLPPT